MKKKTTIFIVASIVLVCLITSISVFVEQPRQTACTHESGWDYRFCSGMLNTILDQQSCLASGCEFNIDVYFTGACCVDCGYVDYYYLNHREETYGHECSIADRIDCKFKVL